jgi:Flp pilus assembly pilin Flp
MLRNFWNDQSGFIVSLEMILIATVVVLGLIVGMSEVTIALNTELNDISNAVGALVQSYATPNLKGFDRYTGKQYSFFGGSRYIDFHDDCDNNRSCDVVGQTPWFTCG